MHRIDTPSRQKDKFGAGKDGFTRGDPQTGTQATQVSADILDAMQEELCSVIELSGLPLKKSENNQLYKAIEILLDAVIPIGVVLPWVGDTPPNDRFVIVKNQTFDKVALPKLAALFPSGQIPFDPRGLALRWWDNGRGRDTGRSLLSEQGDAIRNITGQVANVYIENPAAAALGALAFNGTGFTSLTAGSQQIQYRNLSFDASRVVQTASENRMANISMTPIMRVK
ncbi:hypothetical protein [Aeromonas hydrophila]|uniref:hypothetical protein n=1 Tax=Aeromonas hydrophila TaxID=644 RepID=UPI002B0542AB|nr:hypothetical protein [Aeromonas hydrophila]